MTLAMLAGISKRGAHCVIPETSSLKKFFFVFLIEEANLRFIDHAPISAGTWDDSSQSNQLYLYMGARESGYPATWDKARMSLKDYVNNAFSAYKDEIIIDEGSGLSRENRISPRAMLAVLERFKPYALFLPLSKGCRIKSGTMNNIYSYAGYFVDKETYDPFVIILNQSGNNRGEALDLMEHIYRKSP